MQNVISTSTEHQTAQMKGTCVPDLIALMDVVALSLLPAPGNDGQLQLSNSPILLLAHLWSNATQPIMNQEEITLLSNLLQTAPTPNACKAPPASAGVEPHLNQTMRSFIVQEWRRHLMSQPGMKRDGRIRIHLKTEPDLNLADPFGMALKENSNKKLWLSS